MRKKYGFTLIELLAVLVILAIIALIATPIISRIINDSRRRGYNISTRMLISSAKTYYIENTFDLVNAGINGKTNLFNEISKNMQGEMPDNGKIYINEEGQVGVALTYNKFCYILDFKSQDILETDDIENCEILYTDSVLNGADPELDDAMIPIVFTSNGEIEKAHVRTAWYNYENKQWANAILVSDETREEYKKAKPGTKINAKDVRAYYVWVPRYRYQIFTDVNEIENITIIEPSQYANHAKIINVEFEDNATIKSAGISKDSWLTHPAFTFGDEELNGIWVGKYETTGNASAPTVLAYDSRYDETTGKSGRSMRSQNVSTQFLTSQKIKYGLKEKEASMLKNMEWGAIAYLSSSKYGQATTEIMINNSTKYNTGCAATVAPTTTLGGYLEQADHTEGYYAGCENEWYTSNGQKASTTGNMYGIYDMSGGAWEYVMGVVEDSLESKNPLSGRHNVNNSGFNGNFGCPECIIEDKLEESNATITSLTDGARWPDNKYFDIYLYSEIYGIDYNRGHLGDATYELEEFKKWQDPDKVKRNHSSWHKDYAYFTNIEDPWFVRGGYWKYGASSGVFAFYGCSGGPHSTYSFRSVLR